MNKLSELMDARDHAHLEMATAKTIAERKQWRVKLDQIAREIDAAESEAAPDELTVIAQESGEY